jgi:GAF domain-containing protein
MSAGRDADGDRGRPIAGPTIDRPTGLPSRSAAGRLESIVVAAAEVLRVDSVGAMLLDAGGSLRLIGASDALARAMEDTQIELDDGPGIEATRTGRDVVVADLARAGRWRALAERLVPIGGGAVLSSPIRVHDAVVGNLNAIARQPHRWTPGEIRAAGAYARMIGALLEGSARPRTDDPVPETVDLEPARAVHPTLDEEARADRP